MCEVDEYVGPEGILSRKHVSCTTGAGHLEVLANHEGRRRIISTSNEGVLGGYPEGVVALVKLGCHVFYWSDRHHAAPNAELVGGNAVLRSGRDTTARLGTYDRGGTRAHQDILQKAKSGIGDKTCITRLICGMDV